jgi:hypothetical protein
MTVFGLLHQRIVTSGARLSLRLSGSALAAVGLVCGGLSAAEAANFTCSWNDASANWTTAADWSNCNSTFPNNGGGNTYNATISTGDPTLTTAITIGSVTINSPGTWSTTGTGAATLTRNLTNAGVLDVDTGDGEGGGNLTMGGTLANTKTVQMGNGQFLNAGAANTMTLGALTNAHTGMISVFGSSANQAKFNVTGGTASNSGDLEIHENVAVTTAAGVNLTNNGTFNIDTGLGQGASTATIGGTLGNAATLNIGNTSLSAPTTVTAAAFTNSGTVNLAGNTSNSANATKVTVNGQASNSGTVNLPTTTSLTVTGTGNAYSQTGGSTNLSGGTLAAPNVNITGGKMQGV